MINQTVKILLCLILIAVSHGLLAWFSNLPQDAGADVPAGKLLSLSFAPFRDGFSPIEHKFPLPEHIDEDLALLAEKTLNIRTYSTLGGMESTPDFARKHGVNMIQGAWLGNDRQGNQGEIEALIRSANTHPDVVRRVIVGNEVLLRNDLKVDELIGYLRQVKQAIKQPVSYSDVWSIYMKYPQLFYEVDFISIHILPYWEDEPIAVDQGAEHIERIYKQIQNKMLDMGLSKPILIGESGWPSVGRQRGYAAPGVVNETKYIRSMVETANRHGFDYNIVEAFNQPWKSQHEGVVGANWGLFSIAREPILALTGPVTENPDWALHFAQATVLWLLIAAGYFRKLKSLSMPRLLLFLGLAQVLCVLLVTMANFLWHTSYSSSQRGYAVFMVVANAALGVLLSRRFHGLLADKADAEPLAKRLRIVYLFFIVMALYKTYGLAFDGRYLSFPNEQFAIPAFGVLGLIVCLATRQRKLDRRTLAIDRLTGGNAHGAYDGLVAYALSIGAAALLVGEVRAFMGANDFVQAHPDFMDGLPYALSYTLYNRQMMTWTLYILVLSIPFWPGAYRKARSRIEPRGR